MNWKSFCYERRLQCVTPSFFGGEKCQQTYPTPLHPLPPHWTSTAERLGHCTVKSNVYFKYLNYVLVISHSELTSYNPYTDAFFVSLERYIEYYIIILNAGFDFI